MRITSASLAAWMSWVALSRPSLTDSATIRSRSGSTPPIGERPALMASTFQPEVGEDALDDDDLGRLGAALADPGMRQQGRHGHADDPGADDGDLLHRPGRDAILFKSQRHNFGLGSGGDCLADALASSGPANPPSDPIDNGSVSGSYLIHFQHVMTMQVTILSSLFRRVHLHLPPTVAAEQRFRRARSPVARAAAPDRRSSRHGSGPGPRHRGRTGRTESAPPFH